MKTNNLLKYSILSLIFLLTSINIIYFANNTMLYSDGVQHLEIIDKGYEAQTLVADFDYLLAPFGYPRFNETSYYYPPGFETIGIEFKILNYDKIPYVISIFFAILLMATIFNIIKNEKNWIIGSIMIIGLNMLVYNGGDQDIIIAFVTIFLYWVLSKDFSINKKISLSLIFLTYGVFMKQTFYVIFFPLILILTYQIYISKYLRWRKMLVTGFILTILIIPIFAFQIINTGTLLNQNIDYNKNFLGVFEPNYQNIEDWQKELDNVVDLTQLARDGEQKYFQDINPIKKNTFDKENLKELFDIKSSLVYLIFILFIIALFYNYKNFTMIILISSSLIVLFLTSKVQYALYLPLFLLIFVSQSKLEISKNSKMIIAFCFVVLLTTSAYQYSFELSENINSKFETKPFNINALIRVIDEEKEEYNKTLRILTPQTIELGYYLESEVFWDYRLTHIKDEIYLKELLDNNYKPTHFIFFSNYYTNNWRDWRELRTDTALYNYARKNCELIYQNQTVYIYRYE